MDEGPSGLLDEDRELEVLLAGEDLGACEVHLSGEILGGRVERLSQNATVPKLPGRILGGHEGLVLLCHQIEVAGEGRRVVAGEDRDAPLRVDLLLRAAPVPAVVVGLPRRVPAGERRRCRVVWRLRARAILVAVVHLVHVPLMRERRRVRHVRPRRKHNRHLAAVVVHHRRVDLGLGGVAVAVGGFALAVGRPAEGWEQQADSEEDD